MRTLDTIQNATETLQKAASNKYIHKMWRPTSIWALSRKTSKLSYEHFLKEIYLRNNFCEYECIVTNTKGATRCESRVWWSDLPMKNSRKLPSKFETVVQRSAVSRHCPRSLHPLRIAAPVHRGRRLSQSDWRCRARLTSDWSRGADNPAPFTPSGHEGPMNSRHFLTSVPPHGNSMIPPVWICNSIGKFP